MRLDNLGDLVGSDSRRLFGRIALLACGIGVGIGAFVFAAALIGGLESLVLTRVVGLVPDRLEVEPSTLSVGPLQLGNSSGLDAATLDKLRAIPGVTAVWRHARLPIPSQLTAHYLNYNFITDIIIEGVDDGLLADEFGDKFSHQPSGTVLPAVLPTAMVDLLSAGLSVQTGMPALSRRALVGIHFQLLVGNSSFHPGWAETYPCQLIGISDRVTVSGPTIPIEYLEEWVAKYHSAPLQVYAAVLQVQNPRMADAVARQVEAMGLRMPQQEKAVWVSEAAQALRLAFGLFAGLILFVAGTGIANGLGMMVQEEREEIGLMRALGARRSDVMALYLARAVVVGAAGVLLGLLLAGGGALVADAAARHLAGAWLGPTDRLFVWPVPIVLFALFFGVGTSVAGGVVPARRAAALNPADALRG